MCVSRKRQKKEQDRVRKGALVRQPIAAKGLYSKMLNNLACINSSVKVYKL